MFKWNKLIPGMTLFLLPFLLCSCGSSPLKIGLMVDLTGRASEIGISGRNGAEIAVKEINQQGGIGGRPLQLVVRDDKGLPAEAARVDRELMKEGILLGIGHFASGTGMEGLRVFSEFNKLMISPTMSTESLSGLDDNFIRVIDSNKKQGEVLADAAIHLRSNQKIAVLYEENNVPYTLEVCKYFKEKFEQSGGQIVLEETFVSSNTMNFDGIARKIASSGADGALLLAGGLDLAILTQKVKMLQPEMDIYSGMWAMTGDLIKNGGKAVEGVFLPGVYERRDTSPDLVSMRTKYLEEYGEEPTFASVYSYETVNLVCTALKECKKGFTTAEIKESILKTGTFQGVHGEFGINRTGDTERGYYLFQVKNAEFTRVK